MTLKSIHVVFILAALAVLSGFGAWCFQAGAAALPAGQARLYGAGAFGLAAALAVYGMLYFRKLMRLGGAPQ